MPVCPPCFHFLSCVRRCRRTVRHSTWTVQVSAWSPVRLWLVVWTAGREQLMHMSRFSDSLTALSSFGATSSLIENVWSSPLLDLRVRLLFVPGSLKLFTFSCVRRSKRCTLQPVQFRCQHGILFSCSVACCPGSPLAVSDQFTLFRIPRWCHCWPHPSSGQLL